MFVGFTACPERSPFVGKIALGVTGGHDFAHADRRSYAPLPTLRLRASGIIALQCPKYHRQMQTSGRKSYRIGMLLRPPPVSRDL